MRCTQGSGWPYLCAPSESLHGNTKEGILGTGVPQRCRYLGQVADADGHSKTHWVYGSHNLQEHGYIIEDVSKKSGGMDERLEVRGEGCS